MLLKGGQKRYDGNKHKYILTNITYTGDMIWQKSCATDTIPFRQVRNLGQKPRYFVEHSHPAIVSCADFQRVQELMSSRKEQFQRAHCTKKGSLYDKHIYCGECGSLCRKKITGGKTYWVCRRHDGDRANCPIPQIPEPEITAAVLRLYHKLKFGQETVLRPALSQLQELRERELRSNRKISDIDNEIARISEQNLVLVRLKSKGYVDSALYLSQMDEIDHKLRELRKLRRRLLEAAGEDRQIHDTERMMEYLEDGPEWLDEVPSDLFGELLDRIICALPGFVDSKNEEKTERNAGYLVVSHSGGGMLRQGTREGIRRTPANMNIQQTASTPKLVTMIPADPQMTERDIRNKHLRIAPYSG